MKIGTNLCFMYNTLRIIIAVIHPIRATARILTNVPSVPLTAELSFEGQLSAE